MVPTRPDSCGTVPIIHLKSRGPEVSLNIPHNPTLFEMYKLYKFVLHEKEILQAAKSNKKYSFKFTNYPTCNEPKLMDNFWTICVGLHRIFKLKYTLCAKC